MTDYRSLTYTDAKIQVDSAIRDEDGVRIKTNYQRKPTVYEYTISSTVTTGQKVFATYNGTYDGTPGYVRFRLESTSSSYKCVYEILATWGGALGGVTYLSGTASSSDISYVYLYYPSSSSYYSTAPPLLAINNITGREKNIKITTPDDLLLAQLIRQRMDEI
jgi:hypothetical protein